MWSEFLNPMRSGVMPQMYGVSVAPDSAGFPLKQGSILLTVPIAEVEDDMKFTFDVAFNEAGLVEGEVIVDVLRNIEWYVSMIIDRFEQSGLA
jgi:hypothetical protein